MIKILLLLIITALVMQGFDYSIQYDAELINQRYNKTENQYEYADDNPFGRRASNREILWFIKFYLWNFLFRFNLMWFAKPLLLCSVCMSSVYGSISFWTYNHFVCVNHPVLVWLVFCFALAGLNRMMRKFLNQ